MRTRVGVVLGVLLSASMARGQGVPIPVSNNPIFTGTILDTQPNLITTPAPGISATNPTLATAGVPVQIAPSHCWNGNVWNTTNVAANNTDQWCLTSVPASGTTPSGLFKFGSSLNGSGTTYPATLSSAGVLTISSTLNSGTLNSSGALIVAAAQAMQFGVTRSYLTAPADAQFNIQNAAGTAGIGFDISTDSLVKIRTRAQSGYGTVDALAYNASGTALTTGTTFLSSGSGMAVANVGANSCGTTSATIVGNNNASVVTVGATSGTQCRIAFTVTAGTEWDCAANDDTTTIAVRTTPVDSTHTDLIGAFIAGDKVTAICFPR